MDSFELNKLIGALLGVVFVIFSVSLISDAIFASPAPQKPGYAIEAAEGAGEAAGGAKKDEGPVDIAPFMQKADASNGEAIVKRCQACHTIEKGGPNKVGPNLWGVVGRPIASHEGFSYSSALKDFSEGGKKHWDFELISNFIHNPKKDVPGTAMGFAGLPKPEDRADVLAYLNQQSDKPLPMPKVEEKPAAEASAEGGKDGEAKGGEAKQGEGDAAKGGEAKPEPAGKAAPAAQEQDSEAPAGDTAKPKTDDSGSGNASGQAEGGKAPGNPKVTVPGKEEGQPDTKPSDDAEHGGAPANAPAAQPNAASDDQPKAGETDQPKVEKTPETNADQSGSGSGGNAQSAPQGESGSGAGSTPQTGSQQDTGSASGGSGEKAPTQKEDAGPEKPVDNQ